ncbi:hypothetical protein [Mycolicibacterium vulneris]|uniref:hypothetical protein n=1 Tax=Mycolicibacterium vulneris TaxID=547163 RepID=UPI001FE3DCFC|nr:hypothetical protein [Mycolicibacterium vulneris]
MNFASEQPLGSVIGLVFFGPTRRLAYAANLTATCPKMAPAGWNLYAAASTPHPATGDFDADHEVALLKADLHEHFPVSTPPASCRSRSAQERTARTASHRRLRSAANHPDRKPFQCRRRRA